MRTVRTPARFDFDDWTCILVVLLAVLPGWAFGAVVADQCGGSVASVGGFPSHWWGDLAAVLPVLAVVLVSVLRQGRWRMRVLLPCLFAEAGLPFFVMWFAGAGACS
ncbi:MAG TPA: hypothetical protein VGI54_08475 [Solirubrobacteraceae bacterium]|jgi:hypothetical protein